MDLNIKDCFIISGWVFGNTICAMKLAVIQILKVPEEAIKNFDEEQAINIISNTFHREAFIGNIQSTFNINQSNG